MSPSYEFLLVREFMEFLRQLAPDYLRTYRIFMMLDSSPTRDSTGPKPSRR
jgi:hypothetical protein